MTSRVTMLAVLLVAAIAGSAADAAERWFWIENRSGRTIEYAYATDVDRTGWGRDLIPGNTISPGYRMKVEPWAHRGYCMFDIRLVFAGGGEQIINRVNICEATRVVTHGRSRGSWWHEVKY